ncbi:MAG TPA: hypothetical protein P5572_20095 [Phycisphaerae bacterium]|nr:hypothetical protein [Phycisphaerae bacterium]
MYMRRPALVTLMLVVTAFVGGERAGAGTGDACSRKNELLPAGLAQVLPPSVSDDQVPLAWWNVLILVNANSPAGLEVVRLYRQYHPEIIDEQVVYLGGLTDSASLTATPADEIISRSDFETYIAEPARAHLRAFGLQDQIYVIITTAGMPYRIEDTDPALADVVKPAASNAHLTVNNRSTVNAASVESELAVLFLIDPAASSVSRMPISGRVVNPYQGYRSSIKRWARQRAILARRDSFRWTWMWRVASSPRIEGDFDSAGYSARNRRMFAGDLYLTARLDATRPQGKYPIWAVRAMLERAARVSDPLHPRFTGYNANEAVLAIDHSPSPPAPYEFAHTDTYNLPPNAPPLGYADHPQPPGAEEITYFAPVNHYFQLFELMTGFPATAGGTGSRTISGWMGGRALWDDTAAALNASFLGADQGIIGMLTYGRNGGDGRPADYLLASGPGGGPLFKCVPGAVFTSIESFNAVTFFSDVATGQAKIGDFITIGGTAAAGHAFEPEGGAILDGDFIYTNLMRDDDQNGVGDLTLAEAVFSGLPYLSWSEVLIGDPLMRLHVGPGTIVDIAPHWGDVDDDGIVGYDDVLEALEAYGTQVGDAAYDLLADGNEDGVVDDADLEIVLDHFGASYD